MGSNSSLNIKNPFDYFYTTVKIDENLFPALLDQTKQLPATSSVLAHAALVLASLQTRNFENAKMVLAQEVDEDRFFKLIQEVLNRSGGGKMSLAITSQLAMCLKVVEVLFLSQPLIPFYRTVDFLSAR